MSDSMNHEIEPDKDRCKNCWLSSEDIEIIGLTECPGPPPNAAKVLQSIAEKEVQYLSWDGE